MTKLPFILLFLMGLVEIVFGVLIGRLRIYAYVLPFFKDLGLSTQQAKAFNHYIGIYQDQWHIVAWFGVITIALSVLVVRLPKLE